MLRKTEDRPVCGLVSRLPLAAWIEPFESLPSIKQNLGYTEVYPRFWYSGANQIRTIILFSQSGFYVIECNGFCAILVVEGDNQLIIV